MTVTCHIQRAPTKIFITKELPETWDIEGFSKLDFKVGSEVTMITSSSTQAVKRVGWYDMGVMCLEFNCAQQEFLNAVSDIILLDEFSLKIGHSDGSEQFLIGCILKRNLSITCLNYCQIKLDVQIQSEICEQENKQITLMNKRVRDW